MPKLAEITIGFRGDTSSFDSSLRKVQDGLKSVQGSADGAASGNTGLARSQTESAKAALAQAKAMAHAEKALRTQEQAAQASARANAVLRDKQVAMASSIGSAMTRGVTLPVLAAAGASAKFATDFSQHMANVDSIAKLTTGGLDEMSRAVMTLSEDKRITQGPNALSAALYDVVSSGYSGRKALDLVKEGAYDATAGLTTAATSTKVLTAVLNSHVSGVNSAREAGDVLFKTVDLGVLSYEQLANSIGKVLPTAAAAGVSLQELGAGYAVLTRNGISAAESSTSLNNLILHIAHPSKSAGEAMTGMGLQYGYAALQAKGLTGWLNDAMRATNGSQQALTRIMPEQRALRGLLSLTNDGGKAYTQMLQGMGSASRGAGATQAALGRQLQGMGAQAALAKKDLEIAAIALGNDLIPAEKDAIGVVRGLAQGFSHLDEGTRKAIISVALVTAAIGPLVSIGAKVTGALTAVGELRVAMLGAQTAAALAGGTAATAAGGFAAMASAALPLVAILGGVALAGYGLYRAYRYLNPTVEDQTRAAQDDAKAQLTAALAKMRHEVSVRNLYHEVETLTGRHKLSSDQAAILRTKLAELDKLNPALISGYNRFGDAVGIVAGKFGALAKQAEGAAAAMATANIRQRMATSVFPKQDALEAAEEHARAAIKRRSDYDQEHRATNPTFSGPDKVYAQYNKDVEEAVRARNQARVDLQAAMYKVHQENAVFAAAARAAYRNVTGIDTLIAEGMGQSARGVLESIVRDSLLETGHLLSELRST